MKLYSTYWAKSIIKYLTCLITCVENLVTGHSLFYLYCTHTLTWWNAFEITGHTDTIGQGVFACLLNHGLLFVGHFGQRNMAYRWYHNIFKLGCKTRSMLIFFVLKNPLNKCPYLLSPVNISLNDLTNGSSLNTHLVRVLFLGWSSSCRVSAVFNVFPWGWLAYLVNTLWHCLQAAKPMTLFLQSVITHNFSQVSNLTIGCPPSTGLVSKHWKSHWLLTFCALSGSPPDTKRCMCQAKEAFLDGWGNELSAVTAHQERLRKDKLWSEYHADGLKYSCHNLYSMVLI